MRMNSGTTLSWVGTAIVATTNTRSGPRPRNRSLAKAKPARVEKNTTESDMIVAAMTLFSTDCQNLMSEPMTRWTFARKLPSGISDGIGFCAIVTESELPSRNE